MPRCPGRGYEGRNGHHIEPQQLRKLPTRPLALASDVKARLADRNAGYCLHTASRRPWQLHIIIEFSDQPTAVRFERYLKSGSGRAFAKRHFEP